MLTIDNPANDGRVQPDFAADGKLEKQLVMCTVLKSVQNAAPIQCETLNSFDNGTWKATFKNVPDGAYTLEVKDLSGASARAAITVSLAPPPPPGTGGVVGS